MEKVPQPWGRVTPPYGWRGRRRNEDECLFATSPKSDNTSNEDAQDTHERDLGSYAVAVRHLDRPQTPFVIPSSAYNSACQFQRFMSQAMAEQLGLCGRADAIMRHIPHPKHPLLRDPVYKLLAEKYFEVGLSNLEIFGDEVCTVWSREVPQLAFSSEGPTCLLEALNAWTCFRMAFYEPGTPISTAERTSYHYHRAVRALAQQVGQQHHSDAIMAATFLLGHFDMCIGQLARAGLHNRGCHQLYLAGLHRKQFSVLRRALFTMFTTYDVLSSSITGNPVYSSSDRLWAAQDDRWLGDFWSPQALTSLSLPFIVEMAYSSLRYALTSCVDFRARVVSRARKLFRRLERLSRHERRVQYRRINEPNDPILAMRQQELHLEIQHTEMEIYELDESASREAEALYAHLKEWYTKLPAVLDPASVDPAGNGTLWDIEMDPMLVDINQVPELPLPLPFAHRVRPHSLILQMLAFYHAWQIQLLRMMQRQDRFVLIGRASFKILELLIMYTSVQESFVFQILAAGIFIRHENHRAWLMQTIQKVTEKNGLSLLPFACQLLAYTWWGTGTTGAAEPISPGSARSGSSPLSQSTTMTSANAQNKIPLADSASGAILDNAEIDEDPVVELKFVPEGTEDCIPGVSDNIFQCMGILSPELDAFHNKRCDRRVRAHTYSHKIYSGICMEFWGLC